MLNIAGAQKPATQSTSGAGSSTGRLPGTVYIDTKGGDPLDVTIPCLGDSHAKQISNAVPKKLRIMIIFHDDDDNLQDLNKFFGLNF